MFPFQFQVSSYVGIDGLGGVHLENVTAKYPGFRSFFDEGSYTTSARCETPTVRL